MALSFPWIYPVRAAQVIFGIIVLGLMAYGLSHPDMHSSLTSPLTISSCQCGLSSTLESQLHAL